jgi:hypothetical protein
MTQYALSNSMSRKEYCVHKPEEGPMHTAARRSLLSVIATAIVIAFNHRYVLGPRALVLGAVLLVVPAALLLWYRRTASRAAFVG